MSKFPQKVQEPVEGFVNLTVANVDPWGWVTIQLGDRAEANFVLPHTMRATFLHAADLPNIGLPGSVVRFPATAERAFRSGFGAPDSIVIRIPFQGVFWEMPEPIAADLFFTS